MLPIRLTEKGKELLKNQLDAFGNPFIRFLWGAVITFVLNFFYAGMMYVWLTPDYWFNYKFLAVVYPFANIVTQLPLMLMLKGKDKLKDQWEFFTHAEYPILLNYYATRLKLGVYDPFSVQGFIITLVVESVANLPSYFIAATFLNRTPLFAYDAWGISMLCNASIVLCLFTFSWFNYFMDGETIISYHGDIMVERVKPEPENKPNDEP